jgi:hypothetical protein
MVMCRERMACTECPHAHYAPDGSNDDGTFTGSLTVPMSLCSWTIFKSECRAVPNRLGIEACGTYHGTCFLEEDAKSGCKYPDTCEDSMLTIQGVIYTIEDAIRVGAASQAQDCDGRRKRSAGKQQPIDKAADKKEPAPAGEAAVTPD